MRIALLSDVHGNPVALDAVLADARAAGAERTWVLGDHAAIGPEPAAAVERIAALDGVVVTRGNTDRYVVTGEGPPPELAAVRDDPTMIPTYAAIAASFAWTRGYLTGRGWLDWLERLPLEHRLTTPSGVRLLAVHAAPGTDDGEGVHPGRSDAELATLLSAADADVVIVGHTHEAMARRVGGRVVVNLGSVSNPRAPDLRASYALLEVTTAGVEIVPRRVAYDHAAFTAAVHRSRHPAAEFILRHQRGELPSRPPHADHTPLAPGARIRVDAAERHASDAPDVERPLASE
jgi:putative phosphoesterase